MLWLAAGLAVGLAIGFKWGLSVGYRVATDIYGPRAHIRAQRLMARMGRQ